MKKRGLLFDQIFFIDFNIIKLKICNPFPALTICGTNVSICQLFFTLFQVIKEVIILNMAIKCI